VKTKERKKNGECCLCVGFLYIMEWKKWPRGCTWYCCCWCTCVLILAIMEGRKAISVYTTRIVVVLQVQSIFYNQKMEFGIINMRARLLVMKTGEQSQIMRVLVAS
jgi:hypothetical protein